MLSTGLPISYVAAASNWFCRSVLFFPKWVTDNDCVHHFQNKRDQTYLELSCATLVHFSSTFVATTLVDYIFVRPLTKFIKNNFPPWYIERRRGESSSAPTAIVDSSSSPTVERVSSLSVFESRIPTDSSFSASPSSPSFTSATTPVGSENNTKKTPADARKVSWFLLHALFNAVVSVTSWHEAMFLLRDPANNAYNPPSFFGSAPGGLFGCIAVGAFHMHHFVFYWDLLSRADILHHAISAGVIVALGCFSPWNNVLSLTNLSLCGIPGGLIYFVLWLQKLGFASRVQYKNFNRWMNMLLRYPGQLMVFYTSLVPQPNHPAANFSATRIVMFLTNLCHTANAFYYCDQVVGTYYLEIDDIKKNATAAQKSK